MFYSFDMSMDTERIDLLVECEDSSLLDIRGTVFIQFVLCSFRSLRPSKRIRHLSHSSDRYLLKSVSVEKSINCTYGRVLYADPTPLLFQSYYNTGLRNGSVNFELLQ